MEKIEFTQEEIAALLKAKQESRLFVAPCKFGEHLYRVIEKAYQFENSSNGWFAYVKKSKLTERISANWRANMARRSLLPKKRQMSLWRRPRGNIRILRKEVSVSENA